jgi:hypothetical protein
MLASLSHRVNPRTGRKQRKPPEPITVISVQWIKPLTANPDTAGRLVISVPRVATSYTVEIIRSAASPHFGNQVVGFRLTNESSKEVYDVDCTPTWGPTCDCPDAYWRDKTALVPAAARCKHVVGLTMALKQLPEPGEPVAVAQVA